jgi:molybdopterin molybdotransferase
MVTCTPTLTFDEALATLRRAARPQIREGVRIDKAGRRVLAEPITARIDMPRYDAAAMDGYAVAGALPASGARVVGAVYAGLSRTEALEAGQAVRIMTGAEVPAGADRVIPVELVAETDGVVRPIATAPERRHIRPRGSDIEAGREVLPAGTVLDPRALVTAAAADVAAVTCWRRPAVTVIASGDELVPAGTALARPGTVPDSLSQALLLFARQWAAKPLDSVLVRDDVAAIRTAAEAALAECDVLVLAGGASRGDRDFAKAALGPLGLEPGFADVAMKPGKPAWYGRVGDRHVIGLPGNPTAAMTVARLFLAPLLHALGGREFDDALRWQDYRLVSGIEDASPRERFLCARRVGGEVAMIERQSASDQARLAQADLLVRIAAGASPERGTLLKCIGF